MAVCFFNQNYKEHYRCQYQVGDESIRVDIEYDIGKEIEVDGVRIYSANTIYESRDILIVDSEKQINYLLKNAYYKGSSSRFGTYDESVIASFESGTYFESNLTDELMKLPASPKTNKIRIYSDDLVDYIQDSSIELFASDTECKVIMSREHKERKIELNSNNIKKIVLADDCKCNGNQRDIVFHKDAYIELDLRKRVGYEELIGYIYEIMIFMQLYRPRKFSISKTVVEVEKTLYTYVTSLIKPKCTDKPVMCSVDVDLLDFLKCCYVNIPYRNSRNQIRNIPYIVLNSYRGIEDNFLMYYRFIECYYKRRNIENAFMTKCIEEHYKESEFGNIENIENEVREIVSLRNHYVHSGYYIKNSKLKISFKSDKSRNYVADADYEFIYSKTRLLYSMVIDIIFRDMLGFEKYNFKRSI